MSAVVEPLVHSRPKLAGWSLSPDAFRTVRRPSGPSPTSSTMPQPTPQYEQTVRTFVAFIVLAFRESGAATGTPASHDRPVRVELP